MGELRQELPKMGLLVLLRQRQAMKPGVILIQHLILEMWLSLNVFHNKSVI
jgi:hypothetical protein